MISKLWPQSAFHLAAYPLKTLKVGYAAPELPRMQV